MYRALKTHFNWSGGSRMTERQSVQEQTLQQYLQSLERQHQGRIPDRVILQELDTILSHVWEENEPWIRGSADSLNLNWDREAVSLKDLPLKEMLSYLESPETELPGRLNLQKLSEEDPYQVVTVLLSLMAPEGSNLFEEFLESKSDGKRKQEERL
jgi:hypothetical protein